MIGTSYHGNAFLLFQLTTFVQLIYLPATWPPSHQQGYRLNSDYWLKEEDIKKITKQTDWQILGNGAPFPYCHCVIIKISS